MSGSDLQALRQCVKSSYNSVVDITAWEQKHFQKHTRSLPNSSIHQKMEVKTLVCEENQI